MISKVDVVVLAGGGTLKADPPAGRKKASSQTVASSPRPEGTRCPILSSASGPPPHPDYARPEECGAQDPGLKECGVQGRAVSRDAEEAVLYPEDVGRGNKALLAIGGRPMVDYVIEALRGCPEVGKIVLVGDASLQKAYCQPLGVLSVAPGDSPLGSLASGVAALETAAPVGCPPPHPGLPPGLKECGAGCPLGAGAHPAADWVLACTGDIPFLTAGAVSGFLRECRRREADFYYPIITRQDAEARFSGVKRTYARLRDGVFTGGNLFLVRRSIIGEVLPKAEDFIRLRKKPLAMAWLVGPGFLFAYLLGFLTIAMVERRISGLVGYRGAAVNSDYPEIGVDVDKISDLALARRLLAP